MTAKTFRQALVTAVMENDTISKGDKRRLLLAIFVRPKVLRRMEYAVTELAIAEGLYEPSVTAIDWDALLAFLKELIPWLIELIGLI